MAGASDYVVRNLSSTNIWGPIEDSRRDDEKPLTFKPQSLNTVPLSVPEQKEPIVDNPTTLAPVQDKPKSDLGTINPGLSLTFKDYCKKLQFSGIRKFAPAGTIYPISSFLAVDESSRNNGLLTYINAPYRCIHGSLRFKVQQVSVLDTAALSVNQIRAYYLPPTNKPYTGNVTEEFLSQFQETTVEAGIPYTRLNVAIMNSIQRTLYFEVPYSVLYTFLLSDHRSDLTFNSPYTDFGSIILFGDGVATLTETLLSFHVSFADETRSFGLYKIPVLSRPGPIFPDQFDGSLPVTTLGKLF